MGSAAIQGAVWSAGARTWAELQEPQQFSFYEAAFDAIAVGDGMRLLDAGCGSGLALEMARARGAEVFGFDASAGLLEFAAERMPDVELLQGDLELMPYDDEEFDAVTAFNAVQFAADPNAALTEIKRVCKRGGRVAIVTWAPAEESDMGTVLGALDPLMPAPPSGADAPSPFTLTERGALEARMGDAGLDVREPIEVRTRFVYWDKETAVRALVAIGLGVVASAKSGEGVVRKRLGEAYDQFVQPDGSVVLENLFRVLPATA